MLNFDMGLTNALTVGHYPDMNMMINTESPRLAVTPGEWYVSNVLATMSTGFPRRDGIPDVIGAVKLDCGTVWGFPQIDSAAVDCGAVELDDLNFRRTSFPPDEFSAGREGDYIWLAPLAGSSVRARSVTGSLLVGSFHRLVRSCLCSAVLSLRWIESADVPPCRHLQTPVGRSTPDICSSIRTVSVEIYLRLPSVTVILIICCCFFRIFGVRDMASDGLADRGQAGPLPGTFLGPSSDIRSEKLYDLAPDIPDVMGLRALKPSVAIVKVMSVRDSQCIWVVQTPDDHVVCGFHEILLHDMGEEELLFVATSELDYLRRIWSRALFAFMTRYQQDLQRKWKECKERFGCTQSGNCTHCGKYIQMDLGKHIAFYHQCLYGRHLRWKATT